MKKYANCTIIAFTFILTLALSVFSQVAGDANKSGDPGNKVIRVGVVMPKVELKDAKGEVEPGEALRNTYAALLNSETIELVALDARLTALAIDEAVKSNCDYILNVTLKQEEKKSGGGLFGRVIRDTGNRATYEAAISVPYGGGAGERIARTTAQSAIINTGYTMSNMTVEIKKNDEFSLNYGLTTAKGEEISGKDYEAKAKKNNDDKVIMNLIEESANDIAKSLIANRAQ